MPDALTQQQRTVNLTLPADALRDCADAPLAEDGKWATLMRNHVDVADWGHQCSDKHTSLINALSTQQGITINGMKPADIVKR